MHNKNIFELDFRPRNYQEAAIQAAIAKQTDRMASRAVTDITSNLLKTLLKQEDKRA